MAQGIWYDGEKTRLEGTAVKCPVCDNLNTSMLCPRCGFDASRDYEKYPTFGIVGAVPAISALQAERNGGSRITEQEKLIRVLKVMLTVWCANQLKLQADRMLEEM